MGLYPYQEHVKALIQSGKSVILQAPTGAGKTRAALAPFIEQFFTGSAEDFPRKCIYSVPMRVLANQFESEFKYLADKYRRIYREELNVSIQTGDRPEDPKLEGNLIFATIDQTLSSFLNIPYGLGLSSANLNAGAVVSSYLVFDELHLFDPDTSLPTTLEMLRTLRGIVPFIVMTATFSEKMLHHLGNLLDADVVPADEEMRSMMEGIGSQKGKDRRYYIEDRPLTARAVLDPLKRGLRTICICNTINSAKKLYQEIKAELESIGDWETELCLLHSQFLKTDRDDKEAWIKKEFGKSQSEYQGPPLILVATQVIEVGVDATCDVMHTELAPASSILQRAGRCARRENEQGKVYVYLPRDEEGKPYYAPYYIPSKARKTERGLRLCDATWEVLNQSRFQDRHMSFELEQALIDAVHTPIDQEILTDLIQTRNLHKQKMLSTMKNNDIGSARELIRDINNIFVLLHPEPENDEHLKHNPWYYDGFSMTPGSLSQFFKEIKNFVGTHKIPWIMKSAKKIDENERYIGNEGPSRQPHEYTWYSLNSEKEINGCPVIAVHPGSAHYDPELGIVFDISDFPAPLFRRPRERRHENYQYYLESFAEHVAGLLKAYLHPIYEFKSDIVRLPLREEVAYAMVRLENKLQIPAGSLDQMLRALFVSHDLGKLNREWQDWAHTWQKLAGQFFGGRDLNVSKNYMIAHTDFEPSKEQKALQKKMYRRPPHAAEGAVAAAGLLDALCVDNGVIWQAALTAVARHHSAITCSYRSFKCHPAAKKAVQEALQVVGLPETLVDRVKWQDDGTLLLSQGMVDFQEITSLLLYFLFVRVLRLADQRSQADKLNQS